MQSVGEAEGVLGEVFVSGRPLVQADLRQHVSFAALPAAGDGRVLSVMVAPLSYGAKRLGVLAVARPALAAVMTAQDIVPHLSTRSTALKQAIKRFITNWNGGEIWVIRSVEDEIVYDQAVEKQVEEVKAQSKIHCVDDLLHSGATWEI